MKAHERLGLSLQPGMEMGYVVADAGGWLVEVEENAKHFDVRHYAGLLDKASKSAPAGSDVAVAAVKSAIAAATSAFDNMNKAAKQVSEIAEANVAAATNATVKAVGSSAGSKKKAK